jgi:hypothetical protein
MASRDVSRFTHALQYQQRDGSWRDGHLGYTLTEARGVAKAGRERTGRAVRVVRVKPDAGERDA